MRIARPGEEHLETLYRVRRQTQFLRYGSLFDNQRSFLREQGVDPARCAIVGYESLSWRLKKFFVVTDTGETFSFVEVTGCRADDPRIGKISDWTGAADPDLERHEAEIEVGRRLVRGDIYFPPALYDVRYPMHGAAVLAGVEDPVKVLLGESTADDAQIFAFTGVGRSVARRFDEGDDAARWMQDSRRRSVFGVPHLVPPWVEDPFGFARDQAVREHPLGQYRCPCCTYLTLMERGDYETCPVCWWEDDGWDDLDMVSGPNHITLREARRNFSRFGACVERLIKHARRPLPQEL